MKNTNSAKKKTSKLNTDEKCQYNNRRCKKKNG